jgi:ribulose-5-phosphate 4-epimerase/fuculose-1-phosphate aldolase
MLYPLLFTTDHEQPPSDPIAVRAYRKRELALAYRVFGALGWGSLGDGHISARDPELADHFWLGRYGAAFNTMTIADLLLVGPDGTVVDAPGGLNSGINAAAYHIHWPIHEARPDIVAAAHTHTGYGTPFAARAELLTAICQEACQVIHTQSVFDDEELDIVGLDGGKRIAAALADNDVVFMRNHGVLTVGGSIAEAVALFVVTERVCEVQMKAGDRGRPISAEGAAQVTAGLATAQQLWLQFQWLLRSHVPDPTVVGPDC